MNEMRRMTDQPFLYDRAVEEDHHKHACQKYAAAHSLCTGGYLLKRRGVLHAGQKCNRIELFKGSGAEKLRPHIGSHRIAEAPGEVEQLCQEDAPGPDHIQKKIDMKIPVVHHGKKYGERTHDDDPVWMRNAGGEQYRVGYEADIDSPLRILPAGLQADEIACGYENSETDDGIINLSENHFGMIGNGVQKCKIAEIGTVEHIGKAKADSVPGTGNQNPEDENGRERKNRAADDLPDILLTKKK